MNVEANMYCRNCGKLLQDGDKFCVSCGTRVREDEASGLDNLNFTPPFKQEGQGYQDMSHGASTQAAASFPWNVEGYPTGGSKKTDEIDFNWQSVLEEKAKQKEEPDRSFIEGRGFGEVKAPVYEQMPQTPVYEQKPQMPVYEQMPQAPKFEEKPAAVGFDANPAVSSGAVGEQPIYVQYDTPVGEPATQTPQTPVYDTQAMQTPETPVYEAPVAPVYETPAVAAYEAPKYEEPIVSEPETMGNSLEEELFNEIQQSSSDDLDKTIKVEKFYTFNKKNEEFQQLLDKEYEKLKGEKGGFVPPFVEPKSEAQAEPNIDEEPVGFSPIEEMTAEEPAVDAIFDEPQALTENPDEPVGEDFPGEGPRETPEGILDETPEGISDEIPEGISDETPEGILDETPEEAAEEVAEDAASEKPPVIDAIFADDEPKEYEPPAESFGGAAKGEANPYAEVFEKVVAGEIEDEPEVADVSWDATPSEGTDAVQAADDVPYEEKEAKPSLDSIFADFDDNDDFEAKEAKEVGPKKKGSALRVIIVILVLAVVLEGGILCVKHFAPDSSLAKTIDDTYLKIAGLFGGGENGGEEPVDTTTDIAAIIEAVKASNANIGVVEENKELVFQENVNYGFDEITSCYDFTDSIWYLAEDGTEIKYGNELVGTLISYYSQWVDLANGTNDDVIELVKEDTELHDRLKGITPDDAVTYGINKLQIGQIKTGEKGFYAYTAVTKVDSATNKESVEKNIVYMEPNGKSMQIIDIKEF